MRRLGISQVNILRRSEAGSNPTSIFHNVSVPNLNIKENPTEGIDECALQNYDDSKKHPGSRLFTSRKDEIHTRRIVTQKGRYANKLKAHRGS